MRFKARNIVMLTCFALLGTVRIGESLISTTVAIHLRVELGVADTTSQTRFECSAALACTCTCITREAISVFRDRVGEPTGRRCHLKNKEHQQ
jgi:hypothetical protein